MKKLVTAVGFCLAMFSMHSNAASFTYNSTSYSDSGTEVFSLKDTDGVIDDIAAFLVLEDAGFASSNKFGLYAIGSPSTKLQIFAGSASPFSGATVRWDNLTGDACLWGGSACVSSSVSIDQNAFGFYLDGPGGTFYSQTSLNADGFDHFIAALVGGSGGYDYLFGWEDLYGAGDKDYNDMIVGVHDIKAVPVPAALWLFGSGIAGLIGFGKRKKANLAPVAA